MRPNTNNASMRITGQKPTLTKKRTPQSPIKKTPKLRIAFLLGVVAAKWWINHRHQRVRVHLPESKKYLAKELRTIFGGTIHTLRHPNKPGVMWQVTSKSSFELLLKAARRISDGQPDEFMEALASFVSEFA
jgi:hypothetical protein